MINRIIRVVIIDDDYDDYLLTKSILSEITASDYSVEWVCTVDDASRVLREQRADIYLLDYHLGPKTGLEILEEIKDVDLKIPIILLTGQGDLAVDVEAMKMGVADFLSKSELHASLLERAIRYAIKRSQDWVQLKETEKLRTEKDAAEMASQMKSQFVAYLSHEVRSPLGAITGFADLALKECAGSDKLKSFLEIIKRNADSLLFLVNDVLDISKIESGKIDIQSEAFDWRQVAEDAVKLLSLKAREKGLSLTMECERDLDLSIKNDSHRFRQIIINLLSNAIKFTNHGRVRLVCSEASSRDGERRLIFRVEDTGIGINEEEQKKIFQPFGQASSEIVRKYGGTGLGLDLSKRLANAMGGDLSLARSQTGQGSVFILWIPDRPSDEWQRPASDPHSELLTLKTRAELRP